MRKRATVSHAEASTRSRRRLSIAALVAAMAVLTLLVAWLPSAPPEDDSVRSSAGPGRLGLWRLLTSFGWSVEAFDDRPGRLPVDGSCVWLARLPKGPESAHSTEDEQDEGEPADTEATSEARARRDQPLRDALEFSPAHPRHYKSFVAQGGRLFVECGGDEDLQRLTGEFGFSELAHLTRREVDDPASTTWRAPDGEELHIANRAGACFDGMESLPRAIPLWIDAEDRVRAFELPLGRGRIVLFAQRGLFDNAALASVDHAVIALRLVERAGRDRRILLDESSGFLGAPTLAELAWRPRARAFTLSLILLALVASWRAFAAREIPRDPPPVDRLSPRSRARATANMTLRARRFELIASDLRERAALRVCASRRLPTSKARLAIGFTSARERFVDECRLDADRDAWLATLEPTPAIDAAGLVELDRALTRLESRLGPAPIASTSRRRGTPRVAESLESRTHAREPASPV